MRLLNVNDTDNKWKRVIENALLFASGIFVAFFILLVCSGKEDRGGAQDSSYSNNRSNNSAVSYSQYSDPISQTRRNAITRAVEEVSPAVVGINVIQVQRYYRRSPFADDPFFRQFFPDIPFEKKVKSLGSGFIISQEGYILTNQHVVEHAKEIVVTRVGGKQYVAEIVGEDHTTDVAVLKIEGDNFPHVRLGDSDDVIIGEWAIAIGNPFGLFDLTTKPTVTVGVISARDQDFGRQSNDRIFEDMIQTDASINGGNSGGPLVNCNGEVIGINTWIISGSESMSASIGLGFALPINRVKRILTDLMNYGRVNRSFWTGIHYDVMTPLIAKYLGMRTTRGVIISEIDSGSPAERAGLEVGDVILEINDKEVNNFTDVRSITDNLDLKEGDVLRFRVYRDRRYLTFYVRLESHPQTLRN